MIIEWHLKAISYVYKQQISYHLNHMVLASYYLHECPVQDRLLALMQTLTFNNLIDSILINVNLWDWILYAQFYTYYIAARRLVITLQIFGLLKKILIGQSHHFIHYGHVWNAKIGNGKSIPFPFIYGLDCFLEWKRNKKNSLLWKPNPNFTKILIPLFYKVVWFTSIPILFLFLFPHFFKKVKRKIILMKRPTHQGI